MSVANFIPTVWYSQLLTALRPRLVGENFVSHDVEGEVMYGGSVKINTIGEVELKDYDGSTITYGDMETEVQTLNIDHMKYEARKLDDVDAVQARDGGQLMARYTEAMAIAIANDLDKETFKEIAGAATGANVYGSDASPITVTDGASAKAVITKLGAMCDKANVPLDGRRLAITPDFKAYLVSDPYINIAPPTAEESLRAGFIGRLYGFELFVTNNLPLTEGNNVQIVASHPYFTQEVNQIQKMEALRLQDSFKDAVRCLSVSGRKTTMPAGVMKAIINFQ